MSANNGVISIGRKGLKKFAFGEAEQSFGVDVVVAFQEWINIDETFRVEEGEGVPPDKVGTIPGHAMQAYHTAAFAFVTKQAGTAPGPENVAEALEFLARLRECYNDLLAFFVPRSPEKRGSPASSGVELAFSEES